MHKSKRSFFTNQENSFIKELVRKIGEDWETIAKKMPGRTPKQIHDRYVNYLREGLKSEPWTKQEDDILLNLYKAIGPKWSKMMAHLPGRSGNDIKNRWHKHLNKSSIKYIDANLNSIFKIDDFESLPENCQNLANAINSNGNSLSESDDLCITDSLNDGSMKNSVNESLNQIPRLVEPIFNNSGNVSMQHQSKIHHPCINNGNMLSFNSFNNNFNLNSSFYIGNLQAPLEDRSDVSVKLVNKIDFEQKQDQEKDIVDSGFSQFVKPDFDIQEILEEISYGSVDFLWT